MAESSNNNNINILNKTFDVIELMASDPREWGVTELSRRLNIVKSGIFRILNTLKERQYIYQNPKNKSYGLALKFYFIGSAVQASLPFCNAAKKILDPLAAKYNESFQFSIPYYQPGKEPSNIIMYVTSSNHTLLMSYTSGVILPAYTTATGKCILAYMSSSEIQSYKGYELKSFTNKTIHSWDTLERELNEIRDSGFSCCDGEYKSGVFDIAVPVFDSMHYAIGSIAICGPTERISKLDVINLVRVMKNASASISSII